MQDNGKLRVRKDNVNIEPFITHLKKSSKMITVSYDRTFVHAFLYNVADIQSYNRKQLESMHKLDIVLRYDQDSGRLYIIINNSLRKWYFGRKSMKDFSFKDFMRCIKLLCKLLGITLEEILNAQVFEIELGYTLRFPSHMKSVLKCAIKHKTLRDASYYKSTTAFEGVNYNFSMYDKFRELHDTGLVNKCNYDKFRKHFFVLRVEINYEKVSGEGFAKKRLRHVADVIENWELIFDEVTNHLANIVYVDWLSPRMMERVDKNTDSDFDILLISLAIDNLGMQRLNELLNLHSNRPSLLLDKYVKFAEAFRDLRKPTYKQVLLEAAVKKKERLMVGYHLI